MPGPPGFATSDPIRSSGDDAGRRISESGTVSVDGRSQSTGTVSVPHSKPPPQSAHAMLVSKTGSGAHVVVVGGTVVRGVVVVAAVRADAGTEIDTVAAASSPTTRACSRASGHARSAAIACR